MSDKQLESAILEAVQQAIDSNMPIRSFIEEVAVQWEEELRERARKASKEFSKITEHYK